jgi:hypothetical protein
MPIMSTYGFLIEACASIQTWNFCCKTRDSYLSILD